jgi:NADPH:quinone reductase-like Zn-dependent oxidoreductase
VAAVTALQGLRDHGRLTAGQAVLINGASGGVGTFAIQIAKSLGAEVTAVCSGANVELVRSLGADHVVDYTTNDFTATDRMYDVILDNIGNQPLAACRRILTKHGALVIVSGPKTSKLLGPVKRVVAAKLKFAFASQRAVVFTADVTADELRTLIAMVEAGTLRSVIDRRYPLSDTAEAVRHLEHGHARGKVIIDVVSPIG